MHLSSFRHLVILSFTFILFLGRALGQEDSLFSSEGLEFVDGSSAVDTSASLGEVPDDLVFTDGADTSAAGAAPSGATGGGVAPVAGRSLWGIFLAGLAGGFLAFLMPCIYPMVPLTVSFFTKKSATRARAVSQALLYGLSIVVIYVALGMLITVLFGATALNELASNGVFNFAFFLLLVAFAASFLGAFELTLPSSFVNRVDSNSDRGGLVGLFFMSASLVVVSFSCTGPIIGTLLVEAATKGERLGPAVGMLGFSLALALPFVLFAMFPSMLRSLPSSGGWLNSVKVVLGFLELALALKFLSNVDLAYGWHFLDREVFLALWIAIFGLMGLYLIGKVRFPHDSPASGLSVPRTLLAVLVFSFVVYMVPGMWGAPLRSIAAFLPPIGTQDFDLSPGPGAQATAGGGDPTGRKHYGHFHSRATIKGFDPYYDYQEALQAARELDRPLLVDFTGWTCVNCRKMEASVWSDPQVRDIINREFVLVELYVDEKEIRLDPGERYVSASGKKVENLGNRNADFQITRFNSNSQPLYALLDNEGELLVPTRGADYDVRSYTEFLKSAIKAYKAKK